MSDLHGSATACRKVLEAFEREKADKILLLGDILYHGPRNPLPEGHDPKECIRLLNGYRDHIAAVRGNCEAAVDQMVLQFPVLADYMLLQVGERLVFVTHGDVYSPEKLPPLAKGGVLLAGHTHVPACDVYPDFCTSIPAPCLCPRMSSSAGAISCWMTVVPCSRNWTARSTEATGFKQKGTGVCPAGFMKCAAARRE